MIKGEQIQEFIVKEMPGAEVTVQDLTGGQDHWSVMILWNGFKGKSLVQQHQLVNKILAGPIEDGRLHALQLKTIAAE